RILHSLPRGGEDVGEIEIALVREIPADLDRPEVGMRHADQFGLPAGDGAVHARVAEEARALVLVAVLGGLALRIELALAHPARPARDVERHDDAVSHGKVRDAAADLLDDAHELVAEDVPWFQIRR